MYAKLLALTIIIINESTQTNSSIITVDTPLGLYGGSTLTSRLGRIIYAFRGIRYAQPPIGNMRFKPPVPVERHEGIYDATEDGPVCPQPTTLPISEDCLLLNVYTTTLPNTDVVAKKPVIAYLHHGGFYSGSCRSDVLGPDYLLDQDIVLVTITYRLATLGFLSLGVEEAPGNNGFKDQVVALEWIKFNIFAFGGDHHLVTLAGYGSGAASVSLHLVSPMSRGLFHRAIMGSGSYFGNWPIPYNQYELAKKQARLLGCQRYTTTKCLMECFRNATAQQFADSIEKFKEFNDDPLILWGVVIEEYFGQDRFLIEDPVRSVWFGNFSKVPVMTGITSKEFGYKAVDVLMTPDSLNKLNKQWDKYAPIIFIYENYSMFTKQVSKGLKEAYFGGKPIDFDTKTYLQQLYTDGITGFSVNRAAELLSIKHVPVYYYEFTYRGRYSHYYYPWSKGTHQFGVVHQDELIYLFHLSTLFPKFTSKDPEFKMVERWTSVWADFAKTGFPLENERNRYDKLIWEPYNEEKKRYLEVGEKFEVKDGLNDQWYQVWRKLFPIVHYFRSLLYRN